MAEMRFIGIFSPDGKGYEEKKVGFHSRQIIYYSETNDPEITAVVLVKEGIKEVMYVKATSLEFFKAKSKAESEDMFIYSDN
jgi:hypothetical protein